MSSINSIVLKNTYSSTQGERASSILWRHAGTSGGITGYQSSIRSKYDPLTTGTNLEFRTYAGGDLLNTDIPHMIVHPNGNVSIGNSAPTSYKLDVHGTSLFRNDLTISGELYKNGSLVNLLNVMVDKTATINVDNNTPSSENIVEIKRHLIPDISNVYSLGSKDRPFRHLYVGSNSLYVNGKQVITDNSTEMLFKTDSGQSMHIQAGGSGQMKVSSETGGVIIETSNNGNIQLQSGTSGNVSLSSLDGNINILTTNGNMNMTSLNGLMNIRAENIVLDPSSNGGKVTIRKDLHLQGNLYSTGTILDINVENLRLKDNVITLNHGMTEYSSTLISGVEINRGSNLPKYNFHYKEADQRFVIGLSGEEQALATRQNFPAPNGITFWNNTANRMDNSSNLTWGYDTSANAYKLHVDGIVSSTEDITTSSDARLKKNIEPLSDMLNLVKQLNPVSYELNYGSGKRNVGFIAQELKQHLPELVTQSATEINGVENPLAVSYQNMVAVLCKAVQELAKRVEELESR
jgi:hypothetical protein